MKEVNMVTPTSVSATESARAFAALSDDERKRTLQKATKILSDLHYSDISLVDEAFELFAKMLFESGRFDTYLTFDVNRRLHILDCFIYEVPIETFFLLDEMKKGVAFTIFSEDRDAPFQNFDNELLQQFGRDSHNFGTDDFRQKLHQYFEKFGQWDEYKSDFRQDVHHAGTADENLVVTALVLRSVYGEKRVMLLLDKMIREDCSIRSIDFINIIKSDIDYKEYPLSWTVTLV